MWLIGCVELRCVALMTLYQLLEYVGVAFYQHDERIQSGSFEPNGKWDNII